MKHYQLLEEIEPTPRIEPISGLPIKVIKEELRKFYEKKAKTNHNENIRDSIIPHS